ncbi:MAG: type II toxin-antitoxin system prevent-host-death family antitoxin [Candidatus Eremiobacteraeota bacterium]|nr:type II toxin-antitoxin system prevent-host-death family antitoxin [Candidatus Eremiobacteraeota bacterium]MBV8284389.1 type II toxin-antitoxin system prevent-host-death family antitoxin [Candidatus Eremiobacteraeota bacterium]MBV8333155.1 type II toxin-antitoxin system prevent-host-death family antitoxin [Candidatus Eremiobacteraeota bacterium]MBV8434767.1 type II toxin-antitoxin system prevent-host-death family antitoxin [Candidatus Eremiobacteraeota bacterium]MBV8721337.1 type II toxin-an
MNKTIGLAEAKAKFSEVIDRVVAGQTIVILRNGTPAAEIRPLAPVDPKETVARIKAIRKRVARYQAGQPPASRPRLRDLAHQDHRR